MEGAVKGTTDRASAELYIACAHRLQRTLHGLADGVLRSQGVGGKVLLWTAQDSVVARALSQNVPAVSIHTLADALGRADGASTSPWTWHTLARHLPSRVQAMQARDRGARPPPHPPPQPRVQVARATQGSPKAKAGQAQCPKRPTPSAAPLVAPHVTRSGACAMDNPLLIARQGEGWQSQNQSRDCGGCVALRDQLGDVATCLADACNDISSVCLLLQQCADAVPDTSAGRQLAQDALNSAQRLRDKARVWRQLSRSRGRLPS